MRQATHRALWIMGLAMALCRADTAQALTDAEKCEATKLKQAGKYARCRLNAENKATLTREPADQSNCDATFMGRWRAAEKRYGASCPMVGDGPALRDYIKEHADAVAAAVSGEPLPGFPATGQTTCWGILPLAIPCSGTGQDGDIQAGAPLEYVDNGNGTVTDLNTGLMWEKLSDDGSIHDKDDAYTWPEAFDVKVATLNAMGFAGYTDWRLPNVRELQSIVNYENVAPPTSSAFDMACAPGCTVTGCSCAESLPYWSSTTSAYSPYYAWFVYFGDGAVLAYSKVWPFYVRAVRGGPVGR